MANLTNDLNQIVSGNERHCRIEKQNLVERFSEALLLSGMYERHRYRRKGVRDANFCYLKPKSTGLLESDDYGIRHGSK